MFIIIIYYFAEQIKSRGYKHFFMLNSAEH